MSLIEDIKWKLFLWKIRLPLAKYNFIDKYARRKYCRYGYHKLGSSYVGYGGTGQRMKHIRFLKCTHCNYMFFAKKADKERFLKYEKKRFGMTREAFSAMLKHSSSAKLKHLKASVSE